MLSNEERAANGYKAVNQYMTDHGYDDYRTRCIDLIADILHSLHNEDENMDSVEVLDMADIHFQSELDDACGNGDPYYLRP